MCNFIFFAYRFSLSFASLMNEKIRSIFSSKKGKVSSAKQQLLNKFSTNHAPIQYGVDYSNMVKQEKSNEKNLISSTKPIESKRLAFSQKLFQSTNNELKEENQSVTNQNQNKLSTFETVSSISFQKSPQVKRKVILISSTQKVDNQLLTKNKGRNESCEPKRRPNELKLANVSNVIEQTGKNKSPNYTKFNKDSQSPKSSTKQFIKQLSIPDILEDLNNPNNSSKMKTNLRKSQTIVEPISPIKSDFIDPSLVSVAQRAKYIMKTKPNKVTTRNDQSNLKNKNPEDEENEEPHLTIKDRINIFKENFTQVTSPLKSDIPIKRNQNRFKTQPLSFDDIARANAMILDQTEASSTIASPSLTNSNETLVDISEGSNSSITNVMNQQKTVARVRSCLLNQSTHFHKSIDEEELLPAINVKEFVKIHDKEPEVISSPKLSRNPAVSRRLAFKNKCQTEDKDKSYVKRAHFTQPITKEENLIMSDANKSINDRICSIQDKKNTWMLRLPKSPDEIGTARPGSVYEIQEQLQINQANWKSRVEQKDVEQFTTAAKIRSIQSRDNLMRHSFHGRAFKEGSPENVCIIRLSKLDKPDQKPSKITLKSNLYSSPEVKCASNSHNSGIDEVPIEDNNGVCSIYQQPESHKVTVPQMSDKSLSNFFTESNVDDVSPPHDKPTSDDFDDIFLQTDLNLNITKKSVKPIRKQRTKSKNPLKSLNERTDIVEEYQERNYGYAEKELKRCQIENIQLKAGYAEEALAALSSKEDFSKVKLKRTESGKMFEHFVSPYKDLMLISVKGRKKVQLRLVEPVASSINCGDCYLLITGTRVFVWQGICANVIEVNKVNELGSWIAKCKDLNYKGNADKPTIVKSDDCPTNVNVIQFWNCLKSDTVQAYNNPGAADEDEIYEQRIQTTNMVYQVVGKELIPMEEFWGRSLKYEMLVDNQVFIFDFGCELYLWSGNKADNSTRVHGRALLRQLWAIGYDYEQCSINPLDPLPESPDKAKVKKGSSRPDWVIVGRLPQRGETTLFKEKFSDWPESSRLIRLDNGGLNNTDKKSSELDLQPVDLDEILKITHPSVHLIIDGKSVGRGGTWKVVEDGILREFDVSTKQVEVWHIIDNNAIKVEEKSMGQFCNADAYIIRWDFELKTLGRFRRNQSTGNLSSVFFFWQGARTTVTDKTASALHTINLDKDKVTQIRVKQHDESPAFCKLFDGSMIIHQGKRKVIQQQLTTLRLFIIRGEVQGESHLVEVACKPESLRARSIFLLLNFKTGSGYLWIGRLSSTQSKVCGNYCVDSLNKRKPQELGLDANTSIVIQEVLQGDEHRSFWQEFGAVKRWRSWNTSVILEPIRGWLVSGLTNTFELCELKYSINPDSNSEIIPAFPLVQSSLYKASQPALFIIWTPSHSYLWQGWWPHLTKSTSSESDVDLDDEEKDHDWSMPKNRIAAEKLASLKTLNSYLNKYESNGVSASIIYAGMEPHTFLELFPSWEVNETARQANTKKGYQMFQEDNIPHTLNKYMTEKFPVSRLQRRPLPECVVLSKIEWYLTDLDFENLFKMSKEDFYEMTPWKQREKKKEVNLF